MVEREPAGEPVLVFGSTCVDVLLRVPHLPRSQEDLQPPGQRFTVGGCAFNAAHALGRGGADVTFVTPVGLRGLYGPFVLRRLRSLPWARPVILSDRENGCCYCLVEPGGERTFLSVHGAEYGFDPAWMEPYRGRRFGWVYVCGLEIGEPTGEALVTWLENTGAGRIFFAPGPRAAQIPPERIRRMLALRPVLHLNREEALTLSGADDVRGAAEALFARTGQPVIVTLGADGAAFADGDGFRTVPACPVERVTDTVGAGDAHAGVLLLALSRGEPLARAVALANRAAALAVQREGSTAED
ncbi:MAG: carbohydrate kinase family protein [Clostridia bacterium]|nr:carbohydrate kinase family protein [Clostridia bacterium]